MEINAIPGAKPPPAAKVYPLGARDRNRVDAEFDEIHKEENPKQTKMNNRIYGFPGFVGIQNSQGRRRQSTKRQSRRR